MKNAPRRSERQARQISQKAAIAHLSQSCNTISSACECCNGNRRDVES